MGNGDVQEQFLPAPAVNNLLSRDDWWLPKTFYQDFDGDGYGNLDVAQTQCVMPEGFVDNDGDCADTNAAVNPVATEICDGIDNNCNGQIDEVCPNSGPTGYSHYSGD